MKTAQATTGSIVECLKVINNPKSNAAELKKAVASLDALLEKEAETLHGDLRHYLARRSYQKALMWLEQSGPIPRGICGRGG